MFRQEYPFTVETVIDQIYVDDIIAGTQTQEEAIKLVEELTIIFNKASMKLQKWQTNSQELVKSYPQLFQSNSATSVKSSSEVLKVLGLAWDPKKDVFTFNTEHVIEFTKTRRDTKRFMLEATSRLYDPLGFLAPFMVRAKIAIQNLWKLNVGWDERLPDNIISSWVQWFDELECVKELKIERTYTNESAVQYEIHIFTDASSKSYGAVAYLLAKSSEEKVRISFLIAKNRIAPIEQWSIPRLELSAALLGAQLKCFLSANLKLSSCRWFLWADSSIVIFWISASHTRWKTFVRNRVHKIQSLTTDASWNHCPGKDNPADLQTRGLSASALVQSSLWWTGPQWLQDETKWPKGLICEDKLSEEIRKELMPTITVSTTISLESDPILDLSRFNNITKLHRVTAWTRRFINNCKPRSAGRIGPLMVDELVEAQNYWIKHTQKESFPREIQSSRSGKFNSENPDLRNLTLWLDSENVLRIKSRLGEHSDGQIQPYPILLPSTHQYTDMQIMSAHRKLLHSGVRDTLVQLRSMFWIPRARQRIKSILNKCSVCKRFTSKPFSQNQAPLPQDRIDRSPPFQVCGMDFCGPFFIKTDSVPHNKSYVLLITCAVTRALHIELVTNLTTRNFLMAFRRFVSRRGLCKVIYSDNAQTFKRAQLDLNELWSTIRDPEVMNYFSGHMIQWKFIVERAAWWGGFWERMVRTVKGALRRTLGKLIVTYEEFLTVLTETEAMINSRPITFVDSDPGSPQPLSPSHFLVGDRLMTLPPMSSKEPKQSTRQELQRRWRHRQALMNRLWARWHKDYLQDLRSFHHSPASTQHVPKMGELVIIEDPVYSRLHWKLATVIDIHTGRDGLVRSCSVRTGKGTILRRAIQHLYSLEIE